ncbi:hypothetical protein EV356DRAFT_534253 [Viridothelium virens]|uniref:Uncharacterized protein n=1 Tax=Viridothelium virens TaxID=1048519 RepID=A0A6A6H4Y1_VIRVR|nr:hypothetical protein EV356DRAFT_534253 [Viridothelium virens]
MPRREEYQYDPINLDDTGTASSLPREQARRNFGGFGQFIKSLQVAASERNGGNGSSRSWGVALLLSFVFNVMLVAALAQMYRKTKKPDASLYAQLPWTKANYEFNSFYGSAGASAEHEKKADNMWEAYTASGVVAIRKSEAEAWQLPTAQDFPWDKDYSVYHISGMQSLHCLKKMRRSVVLAHRQEPQSDDYADLLHCFDMIRQDILCHADDTLMYTAPAGEQLETGEGQVRVCRDWSKLEEWYDDNTACFAYTNKTEGVTDELQQYKYCPKGSKFAPAMRAHFGLPDDWYEEPAETVSPY